MGTFFEQIQNVTTPFALAAFIAAAIVIVIRAQINRDRKLIQTASESDRGRLVERVLGKIETEGLASGQKYRLALEDLKARSRRFLISAIVIVILAVIAAMISVVALSGSPAPGDSEASSVQKPSVLAPPVPAETPAPSPPPPPPKLEPKIATTLVEARLIWPQSGISDPNQYASAGFPVITDDQIAAIRSVAEDQTIANDLATFFPAGSLQSAMTCQLTFPIWDDGSGYPDRNSFQISGGDMDKDHAQEIEATIATIQFPTPPKAPFTPKLPGVITPQDIQNAPKHMSYFEIKIKVQVTPPQD